MTTEQLEKAMSLQEEIKDLLMLEREYGNVRHDAVVVVFKHADDLAETIAMPMPERIWEKLLAWNDAEKTRKLREFEDL